MARRSTRGLELSVREQQLMGGLARGLSDKQLAAELCISSNTVRSYLKRLYLELGVHNRAHAVALCLQAWPPRMSSKPQANP
jgi:DNA-binding CsgD family transcriptional regulator